MRRRGLGAIGLVLAAMSSVLATSEARGETFDLHFRPYCSPDDQLCGFMSQNDMWNRVCESVQEMNVIWQVTGISFRPTLEPVDTTSPDTPPDGAPPSKDKYYETAGCEDNDDDARLRLHWRDNVAAQYPDVITMMLTPDQHRCCSGIAATNRPAAPMFGLYCDANRDPQETGRLWAHEMGHHWSLWHTQNTCADTADETDPDSDGDDFVSYRCAGGSPGLENDKDCNSDADCNEDGAACVPDELPAVTDTPVDVCKLEGCKARCSLDYTVGCTMESDCAGFYGHCFCDKTGTDVDPAANLIDGHQWTASVSSEQTIDPIAGGVDEGSPHATYCITETKDREGGSTGVLGDAALVNNIMSYYRADCGGPYVIGGGRYEAFTDDQLQRVALARQSIPLRHDLPDVCAARGGDSDHDGICNQDDGCKLVKNTCQKDADGDGIPNACDPCPRDPTPTGDLDGDGIGDICDPDRDGDGCANEADENPDQGAIRIGTKLTPTCAVQASPVYGFEGDDTDGDGVPNCRDPDNDNDGICDGPAAFASRTEPCAAGPDPCPNSAANDCNTQLGGSPLDCPPPYRLCGADCVEYFLKALQAVDPDPLRTLEFEQFQIHHDALYISAQPDRTLSESAAAIGALASPAVSGVVAHGLATTTLDTTTQLDTPMQKVRIEIWSRRSNEMVAVFGEFNAEDIQMGDVRRGKLLVLEPVFDRAGHAQLHIRTSFGPAVEAGDVEPDRDGDRRPDTADNCLKIPNPLQTDADNDGIGNACDADLDGDRRVTQSDVDAVRACEGADLRRPISLPDAELDGSGGTRPEEPVEVIDPLLVALIRRCKAADLDESGVVDRIDTEIATGMLGQLVGSSGLRKIGAGCVEMEMARLSADDAPGWVSLSGEAVIAQPWKAIDPLANGVGVFVSGILEGVVRGGPIFAGAGWKVNDAAGKWTYTDRAGTHAGITRVVIQDLSDREAGRVSWELRARSAAETLPLPQTIAATMLLGAGGECATIAFHPTGGVAPTCKGDSSKLACR